MNWKWFACIAFASIGVAGCPSADIDENEGAPGPTVEFDPSNRIIPFPNNLLLNPETGKINLPAGCNPNGGPESATAKALREQVLNQLDGFGTFKTTINITFTEPVDATSLEGNAFLYPITANPADSEAVPLTPIVGITARFAADCSSADMIDQVTFVPLVPLAGDTNYVFGLEQGVKTATGADYLPSFVWGIVRSAEAPVTLDAQGNVVSERTPLDPLDAEDNTTLKGIALLWGVHEGPLSFLAAKGHAHNTILVATGFKTQTVADPFDASVAGSPAAGATSTPALAGVTEVIPNTTGEQALAALLPGNQCTVEGGPLPCNAVGEILQGGLFTKQYQIDTPNPLTGGAAVPGPWNDPLAPTVVKQAPADASAIVGTLISTPAAACAAEGCPTVIFGHGLGSSKTTMLAIASQLGAQGFNVVAIDWVAHDSRAIRISDDPTKRCQTEAGPPARPNPAQDPQCFAPFLSGNLGATRDNIRQSVIDFHALVAALKACGTANCGALKVDPAKLSYMGISLGGILGSLHNATQPDVNAAVLNVPGVSWTDILENTDSLAIRCSLVDGLIDAGILVGDKFNPAGPSGLCLGDEWKTQPGYRQFAVIGRWVLDSADAVNFTPQLGAKTVLVQEVVNDAVVPNEATAILGGLLGLTPATADPATSATPLPSAAITTNPTTDKWLRYPTLPPDAGVGFPGNTFDHASLLRPTPASGVAGQLGTVRLQTDAITFLVLNR